MLPNDTNMPEPDHAATPDGDEAFPDWPPSMTPAQAEAAGAVIQTNTGRVDTTGIGRALGTNENGTLRVDDSPFADLPYLQIEVLEGLTDRDAINEEARAQIIAFAEKLMYARDQGVAISMNSPEEPTLETPTPADSPIFQVWYPALPADVRTRYYDSAKQLPKDTVQLANASQPSTLDDYDVVYVHFPTSDEIMQRPMPSPENSHDVVYDASPEIRTMPSLRNIRIDSEVTISNDLEAEFADVGGVPKTGLRDFEGPDYSILNGPNETVKAPDALA